MLTRCIVVTSDPGRPAVVRDEGNSHRKARACAKLLRDSWGYVAVFKRDLSASYRNGKK